MGQKLKSTYFHGVIVILATVSLMACGNNDSGGGQPPVRAAQPTTSTTPADGSQASNSSTQQNPPSVQQQNQNASNNNSNTPSTMLSPLPSTSKQAATPGNSPTNSPTNNAPVASTPPPVGVGPGGNNNSTNNSNNAANGSNSPTTSTPTGPIQSSSSAQQSDSSIPVNPGTDSAKMGDDNIVEILAARLDSRSSKEQKNDLRVVSLIDSIESKLDKTTQTLAVDIVTEGKSAIDLHETLAGELVNQETKLGQAGAKPATFTGDFKCLDQDGASEYICYTAEIDLKSKRTGAEVEAVVRHTNAQLKILNSRSVSQPSNEYQSLMQVLKATVQGSKSEAIFRTIYFETTEIVHGKTNVRISMVGSDNEVIGLFGDLKVKNPSAPFSQALLRKDIRDESLIYMIDDPKHNKKTHLQDMITGAELLGSSDPSEFTLILHVRGTSAEPQQKIELRLKRDFFPVNMPN